MSMLALSSPAVFTTLQDAGTGRAFVLLIEQADSSRVAALKLAESLALRTRTVLVEVERIRDDNWQDLTAGLEEHTRALGIRQASFVGFSASAALVQNLALSSARFVRTLVLVNATMRPHPSFLSLVSDRIERYLPLGLPLRRRSKAFDAASLLQRIRCPVLVVTTSDATIFVKQQAEAMSAAFPTSWKVELSALQGAQELAAIVLDFQEVPARCPQG